MQEQRLIDANEVLGQLYCKLAGTIAIPQRSMLFGIIKKIEDAPTISPRDWTPCDERLPEKVDKRLWSRDVLATIKQKTGNCFVVVAYYHYGHEQWKTDDMTDNDAIDVIAWQPLPAAWKEPENV